MQCDAVWCSVVQCGKACRVLQSVAECCRVLPCNTLHNATYCNRASLARCRARTPLLTLQHTAPHRTTLHHTVTRLSLTHATLAYSHSNTHTHNLSLCGVCVCVCILSPFFLFPLPLPSSSSLSIARALDLSRPLPRSLSCAASLSLSLSLSLYLSVCRSHSFTHTHHTHTQEVISAHLYTTKYLPTHALFLCYSLQHTHALSLALSFLCVPW